LEFRVEVLSSEVFAFVVVGHGKYLENVGYLHEVVASNGGDLNVRDDSVWFRVADGWADVESHDEVAAEFAREILLAVLVVGVEVARDCVVELVDEPGKRLREAVGVDGDRVDEELRD